MKKLLLSFLFIASFSATAQTTIFEDSFEAYDDFLINDFGGWNGIDVDLLDTYVGGFDDRETADWENAGEPQAFQIFNPTTAVVTNSTAACNSATGAETRNFDPKTGSKFAACWGAALDGGSPVNNDWLISPPITLGASGNTLSFWVKSLSSCYGSERYRVAVYVGSDMPLPSQFVYLLGNPSALSASQLTWEEKTILPAALNAYNGLTVRFGIRCVSPDAYMLMVDDFKVTTTALGVKDNLATAFKTFPNPVSDVITISNDASILLTDVRVTDVNGRTVKTIDAKNVSELQINVADLTSGVYFLNINSDSGSTVKKIVKN